MGVSLAELGRFRSKVARAAQNRGVVDGSVLNDIEDQITLDAFSGADISCGILLPAMDPIEMREAGMKPDTRAKAIYREFAELQTLTISSAKSVAPVRRLGESHVHAYTRGSRTIAGSMIFTNFNRDVFSDFYRAHPKDNFINSVAPFHVDQIPEFHIIISAANEMGTFANMALVNVSLVNFGTTMSIHDLMIESTYTYVAQFMFPFVSNSADFSKIISLATKAASGLDAVALSGALKDIIDDGPGRTGYNVNAPRSDFRDEHEIFKAWASLREQDER